MSKIGLGIITCNRQDFYEKCINSVVPCPIDEIVTVNDGDPYDITVPRGHLIQHKKNKGVGVSKNEALQYLIDKGCEHLFLIEDDIMITNSKVFVKYIDTAAKSGLWHLMFGYHGPANKDENKVPIPRMGVKYTGDCEVSFNPNCVGAFCYYHKGVIKNVGYMDEKFKNAWEHVEHSYRIVKMGLLPAYWWWPDVTNSFTYLDEMACSEDSSVIRWEDPEKKKPKKDWMDNIQSGGKYFHEKHGFYPTTVPDTSQQEVTEKLKFIKQSYSKNVSTL